MNHKINNRINKFFLSAWIFIGLAMLALFAVGCAKQMVRNYYVIDYVPHHPRQNSSSPLIDKDLEVNIFEISTIYDRSQIVIRRSRHRLVYSNYDLWPIRPQEAVQNLLMRHLRKARIFDTVKKDFLDKRPRYSIGGTIHNIEFYHSEKLYRADLEMDLYLWDNQKNHQIVEHHVKRYVKMEQNNITYFVKNISDILREENAIFVEKIIKYFE